MSEISARTLYHKFSKPEHREAAKKGIKMVESKDYLVDRVLGALRGGKDGLYKNCPQDLVERIIECLLFADLIDLDNVKPIPLTQINREVRAEKDPYLIKSETVKSYNPNFGNDKVCVCGHPYYRHFDFYEEMAPVGCKYCDCDEFKQAE